MTNGEKYKTARERADAMLLWCKLQDKSKCQTMRDGYCFECEMKWLEQEAEDEKLLPCPFCGGKCELVRITPCKGSASVFKVKCEDCSYISGADSLIANKAIDAHNRVAKAVMESEVI